MKKVTQTVVKVAKNIGKACKMYGKAAKGVNTVVNGVNKAALALNGEKLFLSSRRRKKDKLLPSSCGSAIANYVGSKAKHWAVGKCKAVQRGEKVSQRVLYMCKNLTPEKLAEQAMQWIQTHIPTPQPTSQSLVGGIIRPTPDGTKALGA